MVQWWTGGTILWFNGGTILWYNGGTIAYHGYWLTVCTYNRGTIPWCMVQ